MTTTYPRSTLRTTLPASSVSAADASGTIFVQSLIVAAVNITTFDLVHESDTGSFSGNWQTALRLAVCVAMGLYGCAQLPRTIHQLFRFPGAWTTVFGIWALFTVPFAASPTYSALAVFALWCVIVFAPAALLQLGQQKTIETLLSALLLFVALNWVLHFTVPQLARSEFEMPNGEIIYRFGNDAQQLGLQIAWAIGFLLTLILARKRSWRSSIVPFMLLLITLPLTQSRTAVLASLAAAGVVIWQKLGIRQRLFVSLIVLGSSLCLGLAFSGGLVDFDSESVARSISRSGNVEELENMTGRLDIWEFAWQRYLDAPLVGWGYGGARYAILEDPRYPFKFEVGHAHNLWLNVALCMGFPGALLLLLMVGHLAVRTFRQPDAFPSIALAIVIVAGVTEPLLFGPMPRSHTLIWLIAMFWQQMGMAGISLPGGKNLDLEGKDGDPMASRDPQDLRRLRSDRVRSSRYSDRHLLGGRTLS